MSQSECMQQGCHEHVIERCLTLHYDCDGIADHFRCGVVWCVVEFSYILILEPTSNDNPLVVA